MLSNLSVAIPMFICAFMITYILLFYNKENEAQRSVIWIYIATFIIFLNKSMMNSRIYSPVMETIYVMAILCVYPAAYYAIALFCKGKMKILHTIYLFLPAFAIGSTIGICYIAMDKVSMKEFFDAYAGNMATTSLSPMVALQGTLHNIASITYIIEIAVTVVSSAYLIHRYDKSLLRFYSNIRRRTMRLIVYDLVLVALISFGTTLIEELFLPDRLETNWWAAIPSILLCVVLVDFGLIILRKQHSAIDRDTDTILCEQNADNAAADPEKIRASIGLMMNIQQLYLKPDLQISELAWKLRVDCDYLAHFIEETYGLTFFDMIARRRITRAQTILLAPEADKIDSALIESAWRESGFASKKDMRSVFKKFRLPPPRPN